MEYLDKIFRASEIRNKERILELAAPMPGGRLLDLGCHDGVFTMNLAARMGAETVDGIEFVDRWAAAAAARGVNVVRHDLNQPLPYASASFDVVHSNQVIEHLVRTDTFVSEIRRILKPTGYAIISTNNLASWHNVFSLLLGMQPMPCHVSDETVLGNRFDPRRGKAHGDSGFKHLRIFSFAALRELAELHGLRVERLVTTGYYPFPPWVANVLCQIDPRHGAFLIALARPT